MRSEVAENLQQRNGIRPWSVAAPSGNCPPTPASSLNRLPKTCATARLCCILSYVLDFPVAAANIHEMRAARNSMRNKCQLDRDRPKASRMYPNPRSPDKGLATQETTFADQDKACQRRCREYIP
jgi:hypothetical protein